jgi:protoporphyrinogen/coproporphyrinogen III oxidase
MNRPIPRVLIIGAGITGLTVAFRLQQTLPSIDIVLLEQRQRPGGTIWTARQDGFQVEIGPNGFLDNKPSTIDLCREIGLKDRLIRATDAAAKNRYLFLDGRLISLPGGILPFVRSDLLSVRGKLAFLMERFRPRRTDSADESVQAFAVRRAGREAAEIFADALVTGIHAGDPRLLSIQAAFPRIAALEREFGSVIKGLGQTAKIRRAEAKARGEPYKRPGKMWSLPDGLRLLVETLAAKLGKQPLYGVDIQRVASIPDSNGPHWVAFGLGQEKWNAGAVVLACPAHRQAAMLADIDSALSDDIAAIPYNRVAVVGMGFARNDVPMALDGFGYIAPQRTRRDLLGVQWCSSIFPGRAPDGAVLLRAMCGGWHRAEVVGWGDDRLLAAVRAELRLAMGIEAAPVFHRIVRWDRAIPQYHVGHLERVARIEARAALHPGLFLTGNAYHGVAMNDCTEQAAATAEKVAKYLFPQGAAV